MSILAMNTPVELSDLDLSPEAVDGMVDSIMEVFDVLDLRDFFDGFGGGNKYDPDFVIRALSKSALNKHVTQSQADAIARFLNYHYSANTATTDPVFKYLAWIVFRAMVCYLETEADRIRKTILLLEPNQS